jgi:hypothetical protein
VNRRGNAPAYGHLNREDSQDPQSRFYDLKIFSRLAMTVLLRAARREDATHRPVRRMLMHRLPDSGARRIKRTIATA